MTTKPCAVTVGSLHHDIVIEAPHRPVAGETVTGQRWFRKFGGKGGNQAVAAAAAGCASRMVGALGDDAFGQFMRENLTSGGVEDRWVDELPGQASGMSVAISDATGDYGAVIVSGTNLAIDKGHLSDAALWDGAKVLILQNEVPEAVNIAAAEAAHQRGLPVILNAAPYRPMSSEFLGLVDILVVNAVEAEAMCGVAVDSLASAEKAAKVLVEQLPSVVVTAGGDGLAIADSSGSSALPAIPVKLVSTHGAGDRFVGTLAARLCFGDDLETAAEAANLAAAAHVSKVFAEK
ncbi:PfkB family carbohydrate kinase [Primorskyibacter flagellatus]|uniref:Ribokinase n=1 Tax=Primorskyibacter flagellatus TaxID=1387277 RepID=A0A1W2E9S7_9RHOB|nr:PfkB family carbohydrate kinase [Primorskyibacter flagellatus]SMD06415.1 ribokinase [Primorskyibacter flagellatus]